MHAGLRAGPKDRAPAYGRGVQAHIPLHSTKTCSDMHALLQRGAPYARFYHGIRLVHTGCMLVYVLVPRSAPHTSLVGGSRGGVGSTPAHPIVVSMSNQAAAPTGKGRRLQVARYVQAACSNCVRVHAACDPALPCQ